MNLEDFKAMIEIQGLFERKCRLEEEKAHQLQRPKLIERSRKERELQLAEHEKSLKKRRATLTELENEVSKKEALLERNKEHLAQVTCQNQLQALEKEKASLEQVLPELEAQVLALMEEVEEIEHRTLDDKEFLEGSVSSLKEISKDVEKACKEEDQEISNYQKRIESLLQTIPERPRTKFQVFWKKGKNPLSYVENCSCKRCGTNLTRPQADEVEKGSELILCTQCGRFLLPYSALS